MLYWKAWSLKRGSINNSQDGVILNAPSTQLEKAPERGRPHSHLPVGCCHTSHMGQTKSPSPRKQNRKKNATTYHPNLAILVPTDRVFHAKKCSLRLKLVLLCEILKGFNLYFYLASTFEILGCNDKTKHISMMQVPSL